MPSTPRITSNTIFQIDDEETVIVNGKAKRIEFSYAVGETISLSNTEVKSLGDGLRKG